MTTKTIFKRDEFLEHFKDIEVFKIEFKEEASKDIFFSAFNDDVGHWIDEKNNTTHSTEEMLKKCGEEDTILISITKKIHRKDFKKQFNLEDEIEYDESKKHKFSTPTEPFIKPWEFYKMPITKDDTDWFIEEILLSEEYLFNNQIKGIKQITREKNYFSKTHKERLHKVNENSNRQEEIFAKSLFSNNKYEEQIGKPIEFQVPLKNKSDDRVGAIDLITYKEDSNELFLVEIKTSNSKENAIKAILEIQTYYQVANKEKLVKDLRNGAISSNRLTKEKITIKDNPTIKKVVLLQSGCKAIEEIANKENYQLHKLIKTYDITII